MRQTTNTPKQLVPAYLDSKPASWRQDYVRNLRPVRGYPNWWRIVDNVAYIDGPPAEGAQYTRDLYVWKASIRQDANGNNTDTLELYNLVELLDSTVRTLPNGDTEYRYKYSDIPPALTYQHTDVIDSVSLEFDQSGRRLVAFESAGDVFLIWFDPVPGTMTVTNWGAGYTPQIVTDTYRRTGGSADSERLLFYVDNTTKQIVYRRQDDRYQTAYTLPSAPADVVELLKVSKNLYGGLTALYVYEESPGTLSTGSFTAKMEDNKVDPGTDDFQKSRVTLIPTHSAVGDFYLGPGGELRASTTLSQSSAYVDSFVLRSAQFYLNEHISNATPLSHITSSVTAFLLKSVQTYVEASETSNVAGTLLQTGANVGTYTLKVTRIQVEGLSPSEAPPLQRVSSSVTQFTLG